MRAPGLLLRLASKAFTLAALLTVFTVGAAAAQDVCYVDTGGDNNQSGDTPATAKATITACVAASGDGDIIRIEAGEYNEAVTVADDLTLEAYTTGSFTRVLIDLGLTVQGDVTVQPITDASLSDGVFRLGADVAAGGTVLDVQDGGSLSITDPDGPAGNGRVRIPDDRRVVVDNDASVSGALTYQGEAHLQYTDTGGLDADITAGGEFPADFAEGTLVVNLGDNSLTHSGTTGLSDLDVGANTVLVGTITIAANITIAGPGNVGSLNVDDGAVTFNGSAGVENVDIANNDDISFTIDGVTLTVTGNFTRLGGSFSGTGATVALEEDGETVTFSPGPNFSVSTVTIDKDGGTVNLTEDISVTAAAAIAFSVADGSTVNASDDQINVDNSGIVDIDGIVTNLTTIVFRGAGATLRGDGLYGDILIATGGGDVNVDGAAGAEEDVRFTGTLTLNSGGINVADATDDISPSGDEAAVVVNAARADTDIDGNGTFNDDDVEYDLTYTGDIGGGTKVAGIEFEADDIRNLTFNVEDGTINAVTNGSSGTISGNVALNDVGDAYEVDIPTPITIEGMLTVGDDATLDGTALTLESSSTVIGTISATTTTTLEGDLTLTGSDNDDNPAAVGPIVINDGHNVTITNLQVISGDLTTNADANLTISMADEQDITGDLNLDGDSFTLGSDVDVAGAVDINAGTLAFAGFDLSVAGNFIGAADVMYTSSGGALVHTADGAVLTLAGEALPRLELAENVNIDLGSDAEISVELVESGAADIDVVGNDLTIGGTVTSDGGTFLDATGAGTLTINTATVRIEDTAVIDVPTTVAAGELVTIASTSGDSEDLAIADDLTLNGTIAVGSNDLFVQGGGSLIADGGVVTADGGGRVVFSTAGDINLDGTGVTIPNVVFLGVNDLIGDDDAELTITSNVRFDDDLNLNQDSAPDLVFGDGVTITLNFADPLDEEPTFGDNISLVYNIAGGVTTGNELPDEGIVLNLTVENDELEIDENVTVNGTLTLFGPIDNETQDVDLVLASGATLRLEGDNANVLADADITATNYNLTYANENADELISDAEFIDGATVTLLTVDVDDQDVSLDKARSLGSIALESGEFDLNAFDLTVTGDVTFDGGDLVNTGALAEFIFGGADAQTFTLDGDFPVPATIDIMLDKSSDAIVTLAGPANATLNLFANAKTLYLNGGILETEDDTDVFLFQDNDEQGFSRTLADGEESHIAGNVTKRLLQGDPFAAGRSARFEFPTGTGALASGDPEYRPYVLTFRSSIPTQTEITVNHQGVSPGGTRGLPIASGDVQIGNYPDYYWLVTSSTSLGQAQEFDVELTATEIGIPFVNEDELRIIKRFDGSATQNEWTVQGSADNYDNFLEVVADGDDANTEPDTTVIARVTNSTGGLVTQGARFTLGLPVRDPGLTVVDADGEVVAEGEHEVTVAEGETEEVLIEASALNIGESVTLSADGLPDFATFESDTDEDGNATATITLAPGANDAADSPYTATITATDGGTSTLELTIVVTDVNQAPAFVEDDAEIEDQTVAAEATLTIDFDATDADDGDEIAFGIEEAVENASIDSETGVFTFTPSFDQAGETYAFTVFATDQPTKGADADTSRVTFNVTVEADVVYGDVNDDGQLTPADASLILAAAVGDETLTAKQEAAADVSGNGSVGAFDAGLILECIAENGGLPVDDPSTCNFPVENSGKAGFVASGDVEWGEARSADDGSVIVPLRVSGNVSNVYAVELSGDMDMSQVNLKSVQGQLPEGWQIAWTADKETGNIRVAAVGGTPISDAGTVAELVFELQDSKAEVTLQGEANVNDNAAAQLGSMAVKEVPTEFALGDNYPNPFNPTTTFNYSVPEAARVTIEVYDVSGRLVQTLVNAEMEAGRYEVRWDGRSNAGSPVASGLYMYRMQAGSFTKVKTMMLVK